VVGHEDKGSMKEYSKKGVVPSEVGGQSKASNKREPLSTGENDRTHTGDVRGQDRRLKRVTKPNTRSPLSAW